CAPLCAPERAVREEIAGLGSQLDLRTEHLVAAPPPGDAPGPDFGPPLSARRRGREPRSMRALLCGPVTMMEAVAAKLEARGLPTSNIRYERFDYGAL